MALTQTARRQDADETHYWHGEIITLPTQTEHRQDKESVQLAADETPEPNFTRLPEVETLGFVCVDEADADEPPATQTGRRQDPEPPQDSPDPAEDADSTQTEDAPTQTGRRQEAKSILTDEIKAFIVRGLARFETPTRVAASVQAEFGIAIDRRQVHAYNPAGSRPPAQRWIDLHTATRTKFLNAVSEIGISHKIVRLRMLDRFANLAEESNQLPRAAKFLDQAAKECGGFYERFQRPNRAAGGGAPGHPLTAP